PRGPPLSVPPPFRALAVALRAAAAGLCVRAEPAADLAAFPAFGSRRVLEAAFPAAGDVCFSGALRWDSALPAADLAAFEAEPPERVFDALVAAVLEVVSFLAIYGTLPKGLTPELS